MNLITLILVITSLPVLVSLVCLLNLNRLLKRYLSGTNGTVDIVKIQCAECQENYDLNDTVVIKEEVFIKDLGNPEVRVISVRLCHRCVTDLKLKSLPLGVTMSLFLWLFQPYFQRRISEWYFAKTPAAGRIGKASEPTAFESIKPLEVVKTPDLGVGN